MITIADVFLAYATGAKSANKRESLTEEQIHRGADAYTKAVILADVEQDQTQAAAIFHRHNPGDDPNRPDCTCTYCDAHRALLAARDAEGDSQ